MIIYRGLGCLPIVVFIGVGAITDLCFKLFGIDEGLHQTEIIASAVIIGGLINWFLGKSLNSEKNKNITGVGYPHELFFIKIQYWSLIGAFLFISIPIGIEANNYIVAYMAAQEAKEQIRIPFRVKGNINGIAYSLNFNSRNTKVEIIDLKPKPDVVKLPYLLQERGLHKFTYITRDDENVQKVYVRMLVGGSEVMDFILIDKDKKIEIEKIGK